MDVINAIAKVRFSSARPQRVQLYKNAAFSCDLLCLEPGQEYTDTGRCAYYVIAGNGELRAGKDTKPLSIGNLANCAPDESHVIINSSEQRLICLAVS